MSPRERLPIGELGSISASKGKDGVWAARAYIRGHDGKLKQLKATAPSRGKAITALKAKGAKYVPVSASGLKATDTVPTLARRWYEQLEARGELKAATLQQYEKAVRLHITPLLAEVQIQEMTPGRVTDFVQRVAQPRIVDGKEVGGVTAARHAKVALGLAFRYGINEGVLNGNPAQYAYVPKAPKREFTALTVADIQGIREAVIEWGRQGEGKDGRPRDWQRLLAYLDVLAGTGARPGEVLALRWRDVDLMGRTVSITGTMSKERGDKYGRQDTPKTSSSNRTVRVPEFTYEALRRMFLEAEDNPDAFVFATWSGAPPRLSNFHRAWREARAGKYEHVSFDAYRKAVATHLTRSLGVQAASSQLGHSETGITERYYVDRHGVVDYSAALDVFGG